MRHIEATSLIFPSTKMNGRCALSFLTSDSDQFRGLAKSSDWELMGFFHRFCPKVLGILFHRKISRPSTAVVHSHCAELFVFHFNFMKFIHSVSTSSVFVVDLYTNMSEIRIMSPCIVVRVFFFGMDLKLPGITFQDLIYFIILILINLIKKWNLINLKNKFGIERKFSEFNKFDKKLYLIISREQNTSEHFTLDERISSGFFYRANLDRNWADAERIWANVSRRMSGFQWTASET